MKKSIVLLFVFILILFEGCSNQYNNSSQKSESAIADATILSSQQSVTDETMAVTATESATEAPTTEALTTESDEVTWKNAYIEYINGLESSSGNVKFDLVDLDNDGVPELFFDSGIDLGGGTLSSFYKNSINTVNIGSGGITYWNNHVCSVSGRQGVYETKVFKVSKGTIQCVFGGKQQAQNWDFKMDNPDDFTYSYCTDGTENFQSVTYDEYNAVFSDLFDVDNAVGVSGQYDKSSVITAIENY